MTNHICDDDYIGQTRAKQTMNNCVELKKIFLLKLFKPKLNFKYYIFLTSTYDNSSTVHTC